jgi:hypothetical protein
MSIFEKTINECKDIFSKARATRLEVKACKALRDSRRKSEHLAKMTSAFVSETGQKWKGQIWKALEDRINDVLFPNGEEEVPAAAAAKAAA